MKLEVLNNSLVHGKSIGVRLLFPPVVLLVDRKTGTIIHPTSLSDTSGEVVAHYSTIVYNEDVQQPAILEFGHKLLYGLQGYAARYQKVEDIELLFSRETSGEIRVTIGRNSGLDSLQEIQEKLRPIHSKLEQKYIDKIGYKVHDFQS